MLMADIFNTLTLIARPAAGKSEVIDYLRRTPLNERIRRFHVGAFTEVDDFPMLWAWFEEDALLEQMGHPRLHTDADGYFTDQYLWDLLVRRLCLDREKVLRDNPDQTVIMEFSRGAEHGGYRSAFAHLSESALRDMAILYIDVSWEESFRKNARRFNPDRPDSILEHGLSAAKMERLYREIDWADVKGDATEMLVIQGIKVPFVVFENEDDVTTGRGDALGARLEARLKSLWDICQRR